MNRNGAQMQALVDTKTFNQISDAVYQKAVELEFCVLPIKRPINENMLNELEGNKLTELLNATSIMKTSNYSLTSKARNMLDVCRVMGLSCEQEIKNIIKMSKKLTAFQQISESDKLVLMKNSCLGLFCMRAVQTFNSDNELLVMSLVSQTSDQILSEILKQFVI